MGLASPQRSHVVREPNGLYLLSDGQLENTLLEGHFELVRGSPGCVGGRVGTLVVWQTDVTRHPGNDDVVVHGQVVESDRQVPSCSVDVAPSWAL